MRPLHSMTKHPACEDKLRARCKAEDRTRIKMLELAPETVCIECQKFIMRDARKLERAEWIAIVLKRTDIARESRIGLGRELDRITGNIK